MREKRRGRKPTKNASKQASSLKHINVEEKPFFCIFLSFSSILPLFLILESSCCLLLTISIIDKSLVFSFFFAIILFIRIIYLFVSLTCLQINYRHRLLIHSYVTTTRRLFRIASTCVELSQLVQFHRQMILFWFSLEYVPNVGAPRSVYRASYVRPATVGYRRPLPPPVVPAGRGPGGAGLLAAILGPIGGLTGCLCCLNTIGVWGLFITAIPLTVYLSKFLLTLSFWKLFFSL